MRGSGVRIPPSAPISNCSPIVDAPIGLIEAQFEPPTNNNRVRIVRASAQSLNCAAVQAEGQAAAGRTAIPPSAPNFSLRIKRLRAHPPRKVAGVGLVCRDCARSVPNPCHRGAGGKEPGSSKPPLLSGDEAIRRVRVPQCANSTCCETNARFVLLFH